MSVRTSRSNQSMECYRLLASFFVVFIHIHFPGNWGSAVNCIARCAVPGFFAISGYFAYGADSRKLGRRIRSMVMLILMAFGVELLWNCVLVELEGGSSIGYLRAMFPTAREVLDFFFFCLNPVRDALWYLPAALEALCILWVYVRFFGKEPVNYGPLYTVSLCLFLGNLVMGIFGQAVGQSASIFLVRNGLFFGLPMFSMGLFLAQYRQQLMENFALNRRKLLLLALGGILVALAEWFTIGISDVMVGTTFAVFCLLLLCAAYPRVTDRPWLCRCIGSFGKVSTVIYVVHSIFIDIYETFLYPRFWAIPGLGWLAPLLVVAASLAVGILWERVTALAGKR